MYQTWKRPALIALAFALVGCSVVVSPKRALADKPSREAKAAKHIVKGTAVLLLSRKKALEHYHKAFALYPQAKKALHLIAGLHGGLNRAIFHYKKFLLTIKTREAKRIRELLAALIKMRPQPPPHKERKKKIVIEAKDVIYHNLKRKAAVQSYIYDYLTNELVATGVWKVRPSKKVYQEINKAKLEGKSDRMAEGTGPGIGFELAATKLLKTVITKVGRKCHVALTVYGLKGSTANKSGSGKGACTDEELLNSIQKAVVELSNKY